MSNAHVRPHLEMPRTDQELGEGWEVVWPETCPCLDVPWGLDDSLPGCLGAQGQRRGWLGAGGVQGGR